MTSSVFLSNLFPSSPWGCDFAKSLDVKPLHLSSVIANASDKPIALITLDVGVKFKGQASDWTLESKTMSDDYANIDYLLPVTVINVTFNSFSRGNKSNNSLVSPEFE